MKICTKDQRFDAERPDAERLSDGRIRGQELASEHHRRGRQRRDDDHQQLLEALVQDLIARVVGIEPQQVRTTQQLEDDGRRDDRSDTDL
jgi:hypothetical protein